MNLGGMNSQRDHLNALAETESRYPNMLDAESAGNSSWKNVILALVLLFVVPVVLFYALAFAGGVVANVPDNFSSVYDSPIWDKFTEATASTSADFQTLRQYNFDVYQGQDIPDSMDGQKFVRKLAADNLTATIYARVYTIDNRDVLILALVPRDKSAQPTFYHGTLRPESIGK